MNIMKEFPMKGTEGRPSHGQERLCRTLRLLCRMASGVRYSRDELCSKEGIGRTTFFCDLAALRSAGFALECTDGLYSVVKIDESMKEFSQIVRFTEEEAYLVNRAIDSICPSNMMKAELKNKLMAVYSVCSMQEYTICRSYGERMDILDRAIRGRRMVRIIGYCSSHSGTICDRTVEPFAYTGECRNVVAWDVERGAVRYFSPARMNDVALLDREWENADRHVMPVTDIFDMSGERTYHVRVRLDARARNLLEEERPKAVMHLTREDGCSWVLDTEVCSREGIGRFVMGLACDTEILEGSELIGFVRRKAAVLVETTEKLMESR